MARQSKVSKAANANAKSLSKASRSDDQAVSRVLAREFQGWSNTALSTRISGQTCLDDIKQSVADSRCTRARVQPEFWAALRLRYREAHDGKVALQVKHRQDSIAARLSDSWQEMNAGTTTKRSLDSLTHYFKPVSTINQRECGIILQVIVDPLMSGRAGGTSCVLAGLHMLIRLDALGSCPAEMAAAREDVDRFLARYYHKLSATVDLSTFWTFFLFLKTFKVFLKNYIF